MGITPKNPRTPPGPLTIRDADIITYNAKSPLFRIHTIRGQHPMPWDGLREFGPLHQMRWDPHRPPLGMHPGVGVAYCATDPTTAFAEVFQSRRVIRTDSDQALTAWFPTRDLRLLDLTGRWATTNGASASLHAAPRSTCRAWAQAIHDQQAVRRLDGLYVPSTMTLAPMTVLFSASATSFPAAPHLSLLLSHATARAIARKAAHALGWPVL